MWCTKQWILFLLSITCTVCAAEEGSGGYLPNITLETGHMLHIVRPSEESNIALILTNTNNKSCRATVNFELESFNGKIINESAELDLAPNGNGRVSLGRYFKGEYGIRWIRYSVDSNGSKGPKKKGSFSYMKPAGPTPGRSQGFLFGLAYGAGPDNYSEKAALAAGLCGIKVARGHIPWGHVQRKPGRWDWSRADEILRVHEEQNIEVQVLISGTPAWARENKNKANGGASSPPHPDAWRKWVRALAKRYRGRVRYWEIWNEPDIFFFDGTTEQYIELLKAASEEIRRVDSSMIVLTAGFTGLSHPQIKQGMLETVLREGQQYFDILAFHKHGHFLKFQEELDKRLLPLCKKTLTKPKPIYFTETAMDTRQGEHYQAHTLVKKIVFAWSRGAVAYTWFNLHDMKRAKSPTQPGYTYGLFTKDGWPKAAYPTYNNLIRLLRGLQFIGQVSTKPDEYAFMFGGSGRYVLVAWKENKKIEATYKLDTQGGRIEKYDLMGNAMAVKIGRSTIAITIEPQPIYWIITGARAQPQLVASAGKSTK